MTKLSTCPGCGATIGQRHSNECDTQPCPGCGGQQPSCEEESLEPAKPAPTGESPLDSAPATTSSWKLVETESYVIYGCDEQQPTPPIQPPLPPVRVYSDDFLTRQSRRVYRYFMVEEIYRESQATHTFRAARKRKDGSYDIAVFPSYGEAVEWGQGTAPGACVL